MANRWYRLLHTVSRSSSDWIHHLSITALFTFGHRQFFSKAVVCRRGGMATRHGDAKVLVKHGMCQQILFRAIAGALSARTANNY